MEIEFDTEANELKVDGKIIDKAKSTIEIDTNYIDRLDSTVEILGHFIELNIKFYKPITS